MLPLPLSIVGPAASRGEVELTGSHLRYACLERVLSFRGKAQTSPA